MPNSPITINDVAELAGVSITTVSHVLNKPERVAPETLAAVQVAMGQLGYRPRRNKRRRTRVDYSNQQLSNVVVVFPDANTQALRTPLSAGIIHGVEGACHEHNATVMVTHLRADASLPAAIRPGRVDGIIMRAGEPLPDFPVLHELPVVWLLTMREPPPFGDQVLPDNEAIGSLAARRIRELGHRRLTILVGLQRGGRTNPAHRQRASVCRDVFEGLGGGVTIVEQSEEHGLAIGDAELGGGALYIAGSESLTAFYWRASLAGEFCSDVVGQCVDPAPLLPLPSNVSLLNLQPEALGRTAVEQLAWRLENPMAGQRRVLVAPSLIVP